MSGTRTDQSRADQSKEEPSLVLNDLDFALLRRGLAAKATGASHGACDLRGDGLVGGLLEVLGVERDLQTSLALAFVAFGNALLGTTASELLLYLLRHLFLLLLLGLGGGGDASSLVHLLFSLHLLRFKNLQKKSLTFSLYFSTMN